MSPESTTAEAAASVGGNVAGAREIMLFGVRVVVDSMRKSVSMNDLSQYEQPGESNADKTNNSGNKEDVAAGYASADDAVPNNGGSRERKRGVPWTEEEHKLFLLGLQKVGKGDWRGISRNFVKTRTPTQVASHAQKYFLRRNSHNRRRRRSSLFDITTDMVAATPMDEEAVNCQEIISPSHSLPPPLPTPDTYNVGGFPLMSTYPVALDPPMMPVSIDNPMENLKLGQLDEVNDNGSTKLIRPMPVLSAPKDSMISDLNFGLTSATDPLGLSLNLSLPSEQSQSSRHSAFQGMPSFSNEDSIISVA